MSDPKKLQPEEVRIVSVAAPDTVPYGDPKAWLKVIFQIRANGPEFPIFVQPHNIADEHLIRVARHYLHMQAQSLAEATASWRLTPEEYEQAVPSEKTPPLPNRSTIPR